MKSAELRREKPGVPMTLEKYSELSQMLAEERKAMEKIGSLEGLAYIDAAEKILEEQAIVNERN